MKKQLALLAAALLLTGCSVQEVSSASDSDTQTTKDTAASSGTVTLGETTTPAVTTKVEGAVLLGTTAANSDSTTAAPADGQTTATTAKTTEKVLAPAVTAPNDSASEGSFSASDIAVTVSGVTLKPDAVLTDAMLSKLGKPKSTFSAPSCVYEGDDKTYTYNNFTIYTYPAGDSDKIMEVEVTGNGVTTAKGLKIGTTQSALYALYGSKHTAGAGGTYQYKAGGAYLYVAVTGGSVTKFGVSNAK